jgi:membrane-associated phospholipid phosphatase
VVLLWGSAGVEGLLYTVANWTVGRRRPIDNGLFNPHPFQPHFFARGFAGLFLSRPDQAFPSGHAGLAFATAAALSMCITGWRPAFFAVAAIVGVERVLEGAHYASDVIAGAGVGIFSASVAQMVYVHWLMRNHRGIARASRGN